MMPNIFDLVDDIHFPSSLLHNNSSDDHILETYRFKEFYFFYIYPSVLFVGALQSLVCTVVLAQKELRSSGPFFQYSLVNSVDSTLGTFLAAFLFLVNCGSLCSTSYTFASQLYKVVAVYFFVSSLYFHSSLIQLAISVHLYFTLIQKCKRLTEIAPVKVIAVISLISALYGFFFASSFRISSVTNNGQKSYYAHFNTHDKIHVYISIFLVAITNQVVLVFLIIVNGLILEEVRKVMNNNINYFRVRLNQF